MTACLPSVASERSPGAPYRLCRWEMEMLRGIDATGTASRTSFSVPGFLSGAIQARHRDVSAGGTGHAPCGVGRPQCAGSAWAQSPRHRHTLTGAGDVGVIQA